MSRYAIIDAGRVTNHIESDAAFAASLGAVPALNSAIGDVWDGQSFSVPAGASAAALAAEKTNKCTKIKAERDRRIQEGGYKVGTKWYHSDTFSRSQQLGLVVAGAGIPAGILWKTMDGSFVTMTSTLAQQIFGAAMLSDVAIFKHAETLISAVNASSDPQSVALTGWPVAYGE